MQTARELIIFVGKFASRVQRGKNHFHPRQALFRMHIHGHAAAIVSHRERAIAVERDVDLAGVTGKGFVDTVVDNLLGKMVGAGGIRVHSRTLSDRIKACENFNIFSGILIHETPVANPKNSIMAGRCRS